MEDLSNHLACDLSYDVTVLTTKTNQAGLPNQKPFPYKIIRQRFLFNKKSNYILRGIFGILGIFPMLLRVLFKKRFDIVLVYSPPIFYGLIGVILKKIRSSKIVLNVQDLFPQNAIDLGIIKNKRLINLFERIEKYLYENYDLVTFHSINNKNFSQNKYKGSIGKSIVAHNWIKLHKDKPTKTEFSTDNIKFIFGGVIGPSQIGGIIDFIDGLSILNNSKISIDIYGDGSSKSELIAYLKNKNLSVNLFDLIPAHDYESKLVEYDVGLVCLSEQVKTPVVPGKLLGYMKLGLPSFAIASEGNDVHQIISNSHCGLSSKNNPQEISESLNKLIKQDLKELGKNGFEFAKNNFSVDKIANKILSSIE
ncbi:MAG: hypothetical protein CMD75_00915 [Gammaproteobacteria bacterium]|nr:hypothetical protein [Gammaproteobacteria bacterium]|tara:strand:- start:1117 stop:2211 length:1095 start_codon:yes stop_codon:yes gene_type:complete